MTLQFRRARPDDLDRLLEIHVAAFPDVRRAEARRRNFTTNPLGALDDLVVAEHDGTLVAHAFLFGLEAWFGARPVRMGGVASVGVAPEARGRGVASELLAHLHALSFGRGDAIALLYPFRHGFYARHGYATVSPTRRLHVHPRSIPRAWADGARLRAATGADRASIVALYQRAAARTTGWLSRPSALWDARFLDERRQWLVVLDDAASGLLGYACWSPLQEQPHAPVTLDVHEITAETDSAKRALFASIGAQRDQVTDASLDLSLDDCIDRAFVDADRARFGNAEIEHPLGVLVGGPMVRVLDTTRALEARGYLHDGAIDVAVQGEPTVHLDVRNGAANVSAARGGSLISLDRTTLAAITYGSLRVTDASRLGWLDASDPRTLGAADALFALPTFFAVDPF